MLEKQRTIKKPVTLSGMGLHTGNRSTMTFKPAPENYGIRFIRTDKEDSPEIPADIEHVIDISRGTTIAKDGVEVHTVEHVLAAIMGCELDNIIVELDSNEPPVMDGSAKDYVETLTNAGFVEQNAKRDYLVIEDTVHYHDDEGNVDIVALPLKDDFRISVMIDYNNPALGVQHSGLFNLQKEFKNDFAPARTFCFLKEIEYLKKQGLIKGGDINNSIVIVDQNVSENEFDDLKKRLEIEDSVILGSNGILNNKELRFRNEPARHKLLDLIGDLALIGAPIKGQILAARPGHKSNVEFTKILRKLYIQKKIQKKYQLAKSGEAVLDIEKILEIMPHRYPFLLVDKVIEMDMDKRIVGIKNVTYNEPFFQGHFPKKRVMPGVLIVEAMAQCGFILLMNTVEDLDKKMVYFASIEKVKFRKPVVPGDQLVFEMFLLNYKRGICKIAGKAYKNYLGGEVACEGEFMAAIVDIN
jgi:UDP-3-O-[3-hydroxymyristoyl] N-acetylglucosamine deacetylase / 3-hydroxyacyl-[acyl-carrier-protein] dehydratase